MGGLRHTFVAGAGEAAEPIFVRCFEMQSANLLLSMGQRPMSVRPHFTSQNFFLRSPDLCQVYPLLPAHCRIPALSLSVSYHMPIMSAAMLTPVCFLCSGSKLESRLARRIAACNTYVRNRRVP